MNALVKIVDLGFGNAVILVQYIDELHFPGILSTNQINIIYAAALIPCVAGHQ